jgi:uncharacterized protein YdhG (YjbR/CyaY superfamily)
MPTKVCIHGHTYTSVSNNKPCPNCAIQATSIWASLSAPVQRALAAANITTTKQLSRFTLEQLLSMHGIGPSAMPKLSLILELLGLQFKYIPNEQVSAYINIQLPAAKKHLLALRKTILASVPNATETFSYQMPGFKYLQKPLIYFAAYSNHIGVYALPNTHKQFAAELAPYKQGKGSVQFPINAKLPIHLIRSMVLFNKNEISKK